MLVLGRGARFQMPLPKGSPLALLLVSLASAASKKSPDYVPIFGATKHEHMPHTQEEQADMAAFLTKIGFPQYATPDWIKKFDEEIACDSIEDCGGPVRSLLGGVAYFFALEAVIFFDHYCAPPASHIP